MTVHLPAVELYYLRLNTLPLGGIRYEGSRKRLLAQIAKRYVRYINERG